MDDDDILKNEDELLELKESIQKLNEDLKNSNMVEKIYDVGKSREKVNKSEPEPSPEKIVAKMAEMEKLDKILKIKSEEIKTARSERMREVEECTQLLRQLSTTNVPESVKNNSEQFVRLLESEISESTGDTIEANRILKHSRKTKLEDPGRKSGTFIERNIQLAKCGDGILSLTDEEKLRLKTILKDGDGAEDQPTDNEYAFNDDLRRVISEIDRKLEEHKKTKFPFYSIRSSEMKQEIQKEKEEKENEKTKPKVQTTDSSDRKRLREVDKLLNCFNSVTKEEIVPLADEDLHYLIEESKQCMVSVSRDSLEQGPQDLEMPTQEIMSNLVTDAKSKMPNFKFRHH
ncbi:UNVERIFIED_CONTAM: hypothetical protein PYX00_007182 [Menopon gallinae]